MYVKGKEWSIKTPHRRECSTCPGTRQSKLPTGSGDRTRRSDTGLSIKQPIASPAGFRRAHFRTGLQLPKRRHFSAPSTITFGRARVILLKVSPPASPPRIGDQATEKDIRIHPETCAKGSAPVGPRPNRAPEGTSWEAGLHACGGSARPEKPGSGRQSKPKSIRAAPGRNNCTRTVTRRCRGCRAPAGRRCASSASPCCCRSAARR